MRALLYSNSGVGWSIRINPWAGECSQALVIEMDQGAPRAAFARGLLDFAFAKQMSLPFYCFVTPPS